jgi:hypothetical protein
MHYMHYDLQRRVAISHARGEIVVGVTATVSQTGTAIRVDPPAEGSHDTAGDLEPGDEVVVHGLVGAPLESWVIDCNNGLLRLHFMAGGAAHDQIAALIAGLEGAAGDEVAAPPPGPRRIRTLIALLGASAVLVVAISAVLISVPSPWNKAGERLADRVIDPSLLNRSPDRPSSRQERAGSSTAIILGDGADAALAVGQSRGNPLFRVHAGTSFSARIVASQLSGDTLHVQADLERDLRAVTGAGSVLLPAGTRLIGATIADSSPGSAIVWTGIILPNGKPVKFELIGNESDRDADRSTGASLVTRDTTGSVGAVATVQINHDLALPPYGSDAPR